ncbi:hypothetical protein MKX01_042506 [Papaver californicum]|nr:hypothetical protein MKX01_042506 [Papaver californicum]
MPKFGLFTGGGCICWDEYRDHTQTSSGLGTRVWNLTDRPIELQPGSSKRLKSKSIYKTYMPVNSGGTYGGEAMKSLLYYYDETCQMVKQQYISVEDLRDCSEIKIFRDHQRGCISVRNKARPDRILGFRF